MRAADELTGPLGYSGWLLLTAVAAVLVVAGLWAFLGWDRWAGRRRRRPLAPPPDLRQRTLDRIDVVQAAVADGRLDPRHAAAELSRLVRGYVGTVTGRPVSSMTLADLRASGLPRIPDLVAVLYPPQFAPDAQPDTLALVDLAREVVTTWA